MFSKRRKKYIEIDHEESDNESTDSWGLTTEQSIKQHREFLIRFTPEDDRKEPFKSVGAEQLGLWLRGIWGGRSRKKCLQVVDVRDDDFRRGGHIVGSLHRPNEEFSSKSLVKDLEYVDVVVFHCFHSDERAPMCARDYCRIQKRKLPSQQVYLLTGGMYSFLTEAKEDRDLMDFVVLEKQKKPKRQKFSYSDSDEKSDGPPVNVKSKTGKYISDDEEDVQNDRGYSKYSRRGRSPRGRNESYSPRDREKSYRKRDRDDNYRSRDRSRNKRKPSPMRTPSPQRTPSPRRSPRRSEQRGRRFKV